MAMKKSIYPFLLMILTMLFTGKIQAQNVTIGGRAGISIPNLTATGSDNNPINTGYSSREGLNAAVFADFRISKLFSLRPMLEYSSEGGKKDGFQAFPNPSGTPADLYATFKSAAKFNYLMIPVLAEFGWNLKAQSPWRLYVNAGPYVSFLVSAHQVTSGSSIAYLDPAMQQPVSPVESFDDNNNIKSEIHKVDAGLEGNLGISYHFRRTSLFVEGGGHYGFLNIQKGTANGKNQVGAGTAVIGYGYSLFKNKHK
jgi:hypothetical protein